MNRELSRTAYYTMANLKMEEPKKPQTSNSLLNKPERKPSKQQNNDVNKPALTAAIVREALYKKRMELKNA